MRMKMEAILATKGPRLITVGPQQTVHDVMKLLVENNIGAVMVVVGDKPQGILSERDIIRECTRRSDTLSRPVSEVMTANVTYGSPGDDVEAVLRTMTVGHFRHLPVVDDGRLIGVVSIGDLVKAQLEHYQGAVETLETQLMST
jgi:CBS domain-containing protein